jgi:myosin heavy subunit
VKTGNELGAPTSTQSYGQNRQSFMNKAPSFDKPKPFVPAEKPRLSPTIEKAKPSVASPTSPVTSPHSRSVEMDNLQMKKRTILGTIATGRRELEEVRNELAKLKAKEAELVSVLEKRDQAVQQIAQDIEALEQKNQNEELKRREEEKSKRVKEEVEKRRKEESEEERKRIEEETEKKLLNPQQVFTPHSEEVVTDDGLNAEEIRLMRAMSRPGKGNVVPRVNSPQTSKPSFSGKPALSEADRLRVAEENKRKEEEQRMGQERDLQQRIAHLQHEGGVTKTFVSPQIYDFDAEVKFIADFTNWEEIPITTPMDNNFTYSVSWKVSPGFHFFFFKINGKNEINKNLSTGLAPTGQLINKI